MAYSLELIAEVIEGNVVLSQPEVQIQHLFLDSRRNTPKDNSLFFAIAGERHDGHHYIAELYERGFRNFIVEVVPEKPNRYNEANFIQVQNSVLALQQLAVYHRSRFTYPTIGITGSNGKTIVKEWLNALLKDSFKIVRSPRSYNSQIGVPLSVWQMGSQYDLAIFEAGISQVGEMRQLQKMVQPSIGIYTNIGPAHAENFVSDRRKAEEKWLLFNKANKVIVNSTGQLILETAPSSIELVTWSTQNDVGANYNFQSSIEKGKTKVQFNDQILELNFIDEASVENALHCIVCGLEMGQDFQRISEKVSRFESVPMRMELKRGIYGTTVLNDSYSNDLASLEVALDTLNQQNQHEKKVTILSDLLQSGKDSATLYEQIADLIESKSIDQLIGIGPLMHAHRNVFRPTDRFYASVQDFLGQYQFRELANNALLIKGAREFRLEEVSKLLEQKRNRTELQIDLKGIEHNLNSYRQKLKPETEVVAMVKAFSYGGGTYEIANLLQYNRVDRLAVANTDEAVELRKNGIHLPIIVLNPEPQSFGSVIKHRLEPEIYSMQMLNEFLEAVDNSFFTLEEKVQIHLKLNTGMNRLGFTKQEVLSGNIEKILAKSSTTRVASIFTHLATADDKSQDDFSRNQLTDFQELANDLRSKLGYKISLHALNSNGIERFPKFQMDWVRLGLGLYGFGNDDLKLKPTSRLKTEIIQTRIINPGESVGYGRSFIAENEMNIAVLPIGYADGLVRGLSNGIGHFVSEGQRLPIIGNVCMDLTMIDISKTKLGVGDEVVFFESTKDVERISSQLETIPYEIIAGISQRVKRVYLYDS